MAKQNVPSSSLFPYVCVLVQSAPRESNPPGRVGSPEPLPLGQEHKRSFRSCGDRNRTCVGAINSRLPVPARDPPQDVNGSGDWISVRRIRSGDLQCLTFLFSLPVRCSSVRMAGIEPAFSCSQDTRITAFLHPESRIAWLVRLLVLWGEPSRLRRWPTI